jgi:hypothetical protein
MIAWNEVTRSGWQVAPGQVEGDQVHYGVDLREKFAYAFCVASVSFTPLSSTY